jgi:formiminotetrahydrofolate cyclodeaminase
MEDPADNITQLPVREMHARLASREPIPGGGSAAALAGAMGASLVAMVAELTIPKAQDPEPQARLRQIRDQALARRDELLDLADEDAIAYGAVVTARRMPKDTKEEQAARAEALRRTMLAAAEAPLRAARAAAEVVLLARAIAPIGNPNAVSDAGVAAELAQAAVRGAILNVRINLPYLDAAEPLRSAAPAELLRLAASATEGYEATAEVVSGRIQPS